MKWGGGCRETPGACDRGRCSGLPSGPRVSASALYSRPGPFAVVWQGRDARVAHANVIRSFTGRLIRREGLIPGTAPSLAVTIKDAGGVMVGRESCRAIGESAWDFTRWFQRPSRDLLTVMFLRSTMFPVLGNMRYWGNIMDRNSDLVSEAERLLAESLGRGWAVRRVDEPVREPGVPQPDVTLTVAAPDGRKAVQMVKVKRGAFPRDIRSWLRALRPAPRGSSYLLAARFLSPRARALLEDAGVNYIDLTGNMLVRIQSPGVLVRRQGSDRDPEPGTEPVRSLRGGRAARVVRALCDYREPATSRAVAARAGVSPGYVSKIIGLLEREALVEREGRGPVQPIVRVAWADLIRRWSADYRMLESNTAQLFLAPQGIRAFVTDLGGWAAQTPDARYAVTGSFAAAERAPIAPPALLACYVDSPLVVAEKTGLVRATSTGNVYLCEPLDPIVYERTWSQGEIVYTALSQVAADCLTGPGRMPAEGDALLEWMAANQESWRLDG